MNNYPAWWCDTITLYNRYEDSETKVVTWYRHVIKGCFVKNANNKVRVNNTILETNDIIVRIPQSKKYREYTDWLNDRDRYFTLHQGDIIVFGEVSDTIDEYTKGSRSSDFLAKYKTLNKCMTIEVYQDDTGSGRGLKHYFVKGE